MLEEKSSGYLDSLPYFLTAEQILTNINHFKVEVAATQVKRLHRGITATRRQGIDSTCEKT